MRTSVSRLSLWPFLWISVLNALVMAPARITHAQALAPTTAALRDAASRTTEEVNRHGARWTAVHGSPGREIRVDVVWKGPSKAWTMAVGNTLLARVVESGG